MQDIIYYVALIILIIILGGSSFIITLVLWNKYVPRASAKEWRNANGYGYDKYGCVTKVDVVKYDKKA